MNLRLLPIISGVFVVVGFNAYFIYGNIYAGLGYWVGAVCLFLLLRYSPKRRMIIYYDDPVVNVAHIAWCELVNLGGRGTFGNMEDAFSYARFAQDVQEAFIKLRQHRGAGVRNA